MSVGSCLNMPVGLSAEKKLTMMESAWLPLPMQVVKVVGGLIPILNAMQQDPSSESICGCLLLAVLLQINYRAA